jgi:Branched-chain amino acid transport system / permease component
VDALRPAVEIQGAMTERNTEIPADRRIEFNYLQLCDAIFLEVRLVWRTPDRLETGIICHTRAAERCPQSAEISGRPPYTVPQPSIFRYKLLSFGISSFYAGVYGVLSLTTSASPTTGVQIGVSIDYPAMIIVGRLGSVLDTIFGAIFVTVLPIILRYGAARWVLSSMRASFRAS